MLWCVYNPCCRVFLPHVVVCFYPMLWCVSNPCCGVFLTHVAVQLCMFVLQLGFLSTYLSEPIVKAFTSAAAFHVTVSQLQSMLGLRLARHTGNFALFKVSLLYYLSPAQSKM